jgi:hypothetical protein
VPAPISEAAEHCVNACECHSSFCYEALDARVSFEALKPAFSLASVTAGPDAVDSQRKRMATSDPVRVARHPLRFGLSTLGSFPYTGRQSFGVASEFQADPLPYGFDHPVLQPDMVRVDDQSGRSMPIRSFIAAESGDRIRWSIQPLQRTGADNQVFSSLWRGSPFSSACTVCCSCGIPVARSCGAHRPSSS